MFYFRFEIKGRPKGKARPRFTGSHTYTPQSTRDYEENIKAAFIMAYPKAKPIEADVPIETVIKAYFPIPQSFTGKKRLLYERGDIYPTIKPDCDNIEKIILDSLNGIAFFDDKQVVKSSVSKLYTSSGNEHVEVIIKDLGEA